MLETQKDPQYRSRDPNRMYGSDMAENTAQANIQGFGIYLVKLKRQPTRIDVQETYWRRSLFFDQPWVGTHWQAQDQIIQTVRATRRQ